MTNATKARSQSGTSNPVNSPPQSSYRVDVEESIALRILVQALVIVGIIATDIAASDITGAWRVTSYWAIPISLVGAFWSWYRRYKRNIPTKFGLAIGMLLTLVFFFGRLLGELNDTRLALAQLLIQLQVLHSFDLPRRKDLGYSMMIGLILLGVAGTLSQTLTFAPALLIFIVLALPTLVLDYRSRLGLTQRPSSGQAARNQLQRVWPFNPKQLGILLLTVVALGLVIFAVMPRLPGYQLRNFPVNGPVDFQGDFDARRVINPGYARQGRAGNQSQAGNGGEDGTDGNGQSSAVVQGQGVGPGKLDETQYYGFDTQINQNLRGELKPQILMRVRSQAAGYWRVMGFDHYTGQGWEISRNNRSETINRPSWTYQFFLPRPITIGRKREVIQTYTIVAEEVPNVIPALLYPKELYFPTRKIAIDTEGSLRSPLSLTEGFTYTVISEVPYRDRSRLRETDDNYSRPIQEHYLQIPPEIADRIRQHTTEILAKSDKPLTNAYEKALYLAQYLKQNYFIEPDLPFWNTDEDMVEAFLFTYQGGYPDHFSTVLAVMLRSIGIPTRLATGFGPGEFNYFTGLYVVRNTDAYAVTEVFFPKFGWFAFDPIPGHELIPPSIEDYETFTVLEKFWKWIAGWLPSPLRGALNALLGGIISFLARSIGWLLALFSRGWLGFLSGLILLTGLGFLGWLAWSGFQSWRYQRWLSKLPPMERLYQKMLNWLAQQGHRKRPAETPLEYAAQLRDQYPPDSSQVVDEISHAYVLWRYGGRNGGTAELAKKLQRLQQKSLIKK